MICVSGSRMPDDHPWRAAHRLVPQWNRETFHSRKLGGKRRKFSGLQNGEANSAFGREGGIAGVLS